MSKSTSAASSDKPHDVPDHDTPKEEPPPGGPFGLGDDQVEGFMAQVQRIYGQVAVSPRVRLEQLIILFRQIEKHITK